MQMVPQTKTITNDLGETVLLTVNEIDFVCLCGQNYDIISTVLIKANCIFICKRYDPMVKHL